jgi:hypothetical protein
LCPRRSFPNSQCLERHDRIVILARGQVIGMSIVMAICSKFRKLRFGVVIASKRVIFPNGG